MSEPEKIIPILEVREEYPFKTKPICHIYCTEKVEHTFIQHMKIKKLGRKGVKTFEAGNCLSEVTGKHL